MNKDELLDELVRIALASNHYKDELNEEDVRIYYQLMLDNGQVATIEKEGRIIAVIEWTWISGPKEAQAAYECRDKNTGTWVYVKDIYVEPGCDLSIWTICRKLPLFEGLCWQRHKYDNRLTKFGGDNVIRKQKFYQQS